MPETNNFHSTEQIQEQNAPVLSLKKPIHKVKKMNSATLALCELDNNDYAVLQPDRTITIFNKEHEFQNKLILPVHEAYQDPKAGSGYRPSRNDELINLTNGRLLYSEFLNFYERFDGREILSSLFQTVFIWDYRSGTISSFKHYACYFTLVNQNEFAYIEKIPSKALKENKGDYRLCICKIAQPEKPFSATNLTGFENVGRETFCPFSFCFLMKGRYLACMGNDVSKKGQYIMQIYQRKGKQFKPSQKLIFDNRTTLHKLGESRFMTVNMENGLVTRWIINESGLLIQMKQSIHKELVSRGHNISTPFIDGRTVLVKRDGDAVILDIETSAYLRLEGENQPAFCVLSDGCTLLTINNAKLNAYDFNPSFVSTLINESVPLLTQDSKDIVSSYVGSFSFFLPEEQSIKPTKLMQLQKAEASCACIIL